MIQANELRIGNYFMFGAMRHQASYHDITNLVKSERHNFPLKEYNPIPITGEWLRNLDAKTQWHGGYGDGFLGFVIGNLFIAFEADNKDTNIGKIVTKDRDIIGADILYVHQLQNLYFALTGRELEIKEVASV